MPINKKHKDYTKNSNRWDTSRAVIGGEDVIKGKTGDFKPQDFLPKFSPEDKGRYDAYVFRASFVAYTGFTHIGLLGSVFRKPFEFEPSNTIEYLSDNADGQAQGLDQLSKETVSEALKVGRVGLFVDYPKVNDSRNGEEQASIVLYHAENIINWKVGVKENQLFLESVTLAEEVEEEVDEFSTEAKKQYRFLKIDEDGKYFQEVYDENERIKEETFYPTDYNGNQFEIIPFQFIGAENNRPSVDKPPLLDIANVNLAHYRNSADNEENLHIHGQGTLILGSNMSTEDFKKANPNGVSVGSRNGHFLGDNAFAELLQLDPSQTLQTAMDKKVTQMIGIGARFIQEEYVDMRVDQVQVNKAQKESGLATLVGNCTKGITNCINWVLMFMGEKEQDFSFALNMDFFGASLTAQEITAMIMLVDTGVMPKSDARRKLKNIEWIDSEKTEEEIEAEIEVDVIE